MGHRGDGRGAPHVAGVIEGAMITLRLGAAGTSSAGALHRRPPWQPFSAAAAMHTEPLAMARSGPAGGPKATGLSDSGRA
jgi:hypothetical protein